MNIVLFDGGTLGASSAGGTRKKGFFPAGDDRAKHILSVLGKTPGDTFDAGIIDGPSGIAAITRIHEGGLFFDFTPTGDGRPLFPVEMVIGFPRPIQLKRLFRDMAGLGVSAIHLCGTDLGEKSYLDSKIVERGTARRLLLEGTAQAKSTHGPTLEIHRSLADYFDTLGATPPGGTTKMCADNLSPGISMRKLLEQNAPTAVTCAVGSERGWTDRERELFAAHGWTRCGLGERVLRTETACTVAVTLILALSSFGPLA